MSFRSIYPRFSVTLDCGDEQMTKQSHKDECDIHKILSNYKRTGIISHITQRQAMYADLPDAIDFQASIELVREAQEAFAELPATVRETFRNDPYQLLAAIGDPARTEELRALGILAGGAPAPGAGPMPVPASAPGSVGVSSPTAPPAGAPPAPAPSGA